MDVELRFTLPSFEPAYLELGPEAWADRARRGLEEPRDCQVCPRNCGVNRLKGETQVCKTGRHVMVASAFPHFGEERCLRGSRGSGTIFFALCNLRCVFCQNWDISQHPKGRICEPRELAALMLHLQGQGCHNINLVTPEHVVPQIVEAVALAVAQGLRLPIVYNTSAYDALVSLELMDGLVDIYMPDFKFWKRETAKRLAKAADYPDRAREAIREMHRQVGPLTFGPNGLACRGVLIRHLVMPKQLGETEKILGWIASELGPHTYVHLMGQYRPAYQVREGTSKYRDIARRPEPAELRLAHEMATDLGLRLGH